MKRTSTAAHTLVVGIGSPFGDDRVGWQIARSIAKQHLPGVHVQCARTPAELLHWLGPHRNLIVCDACRGTGAIGTWHRWQWPAIDLASVQFQGTHDFSLPATLELAGNLGRLPQSVSIWGVEIADQLPREELADTPGESPLSPQVAQAATAVARHVTAEARHA